MVLVGNIALKMPRLRYLLLGLRCNRWEREMWFKWRLIFKWENLCPIKFADPIGLIVIMPKAKQPVSFEQVIEETPDYYPDITCEIKPEDFGCVRDNIYALDYGLPDRDMVIERRKYYEKMSNFKS